VLPDDDRKGTSATAPPAWIERSFPCWRRNARAGLAQAVETDPALWEVDKLRLECHVPASWMDSLARAFPDARLLAPLSGMHPRQALAWYVARIRMVE